VKGKEMDQKMLKELVGLMFSMGNNKYRPISSKFRVPTEMWFVQLLAGTEQYLGLISEDLSLKDEELILSSFKTLISEIGTSQQSSSIYQALSLKIARHLQHHSQRGDGIANQLIEYYKKQSIENCFFFEHEVNLLKTHAKEFTDPTHKTEIVSCRALDHLRKIIRAKMGVMLARAELVLMVTAQYFAGREQEKAKCIAEIQNTFEQELGFFKYPALMTPEHLATIKRIQEYSLTQAQTLP
jgi:hypothetical protein